MCLSCEKGVRELQQTYKSIREQIIVRLGEFGQVMKEGGEDRIFAELVFCILTPQSRAKLCWAAVESLMSKDLLLKGGREEIVRELSGVRFKYRKAEYIIAAREEFIDNGELDIREKIIGLGVEERRDFLVRKVKGIGYKEASHFLRNVALSEDMAILDRHVLRSLRSLGVIEEIPRSLSRKRYLEIEEKMKDFAEEFCIPMSHLDLTLWYRETGEVFK
ncbi:N-glycosylase/DNA lyase [Candidatus Methanoperedenaceae archaeon GB37]|nr:N-glycosylase/DNA lyase [Candidatus Methanoperedenaceae archaeon GB37]